MAVVLEEVDVSGGAGMSLDVYLEVVQPCQVFEANITHNLTSMANEAGIYKELWRPEEVGITVARQLIEPLTKGLELMKSDPERFERHNPSNGWGSYKGFVPWIERYLDACREYPEAAVRVSR